MAEPIPTAVRSVVRTRDLGRCVRCGMPGNEWHHRRTRSVPGVHRHCACNGVILCGWGNNTGCHGWVHQHPFEARREGWIVSRYEVTPGSVPVSTRQHGGWVTLTCDGNTVPASPPLIG